MTDFIKLFKERLKFIFLNIEYLSYDERTELMSFVRYYIDKIIIRKFEHDFYVK